MEVAFVIGPYRANTIYGIRQNIIAAEQLGAVIAQHGVFPYIPHKNTAFFDGVAPDSLWLEGNLEVLRRGIANFAVVCRGYKNSDGAKDEIQECEKLLIPVLYEEDPNFLAKLNLTPSN